MQAALPSHPDRAAATLANVGPEHAVRGEGPFAPPGDGARDCRIDLKILAFRARRACLTSAAARARLAGFDADRRPDLWAGTVQDGTARGFAAALEEAIALAATDTQSDRPAGDGERRVLVGKELRRVKDLLVASGGARVRFSRRHGLLFVDRDEAVHSANCLRFEARADHGSLDAFAGDENARARLYSAQFLQPWRHETAPDRSELVLRGRIGRGPVGWDTELRISGRASESRIRLELTVRNRISDWRLRARLLGVPPTHIEHECDDVREVVTNDGGGFVAFTLVRACGSLLVDGEPIAVPAAQCHGEIRHVFHLGVAD